MQKLLRADILIIFGMLIICAISGCFPPDEDEYYEYDEFPDPLQPEEDYDGPPPATMAVLVPPLIPGVPFDSNTEFLLIFDQGIADVWVNGIPASGSSVTWTVPPNLLLEPGQTLDVTWRNRDGCTDAIKVGLDTIMDNGMKPPAIIEGTVIGGEAHVDPTLINASGIQIRFDRSVVGTIKLTDEAGVDLNWIARVAGRTATLTPTVRQKLVNSATYKIEINVWDINLWTRTGTGLQRTISFTTKPK